MALHQMAWFGSTPIGALAMGWVIQTTSPRVPFVLGSVAALACAAALARAAGRHATVGADDVPMGVPVSTSPAPRAHARTTYERTARPLSPTRAR